MFSVQVVPKHWKTSLKGATLPSSGLQLGPRLLQTLAATNIFIRDKFGLHGKHLHEDPLHNEPCKLILAKQPCEIQSNLRINRSRIESCD